MVTLILSGFGLFFVGLRLMTHTFHLWAGDRVSRLLMRFTSRPVVGMASGLLAAAVLQSSSATNIMVVSLMGAGLLQLPAAFGVILGSNVGTTLTAHLVTLPLGHFALHLLAAGVLFGWPAPNRFPLALPARVLASLGAIFYGLSMVTLGFGPILSSNVLKVTLAGLASSPFLCVVIGTILTSIVQSSSLVTSVVVGFAAQGLIPSPAAIAVALGSNVGTVVTTILASAWQNGDAKRAALADLVFNMLGVVLVLPVLSHFVHLVALTASDPGRQVANAHTLFNVLTAMIALPFIPAFCKLIQRLTPNLDS